MSAFRFSLRSGHPVGLDPKSFAQARYRQDPTHTCHFERSASGLASVGSHRVARNPQRLLGDRFVEGWILPGSYQVASPPLDKSHSALQISYYAAVTL